MIDGNERQRDNDLSRLTGPSDQPNMKNFSLDHGADTNAPDSEGSTSLLHWHLSTPGGGVIHILKSVALGRLKQGFCNFVNHDDISDATRRWGDGISPCLYALHDRAVGEYLWSCL